MFCFKLKLEKGFGTWLLGTVLGDRDRSVPLSFGIELMSTSDMLTCSCRLSSYRWALHLGLLLVDQSLSVSTSQPTVLLMAASCCLHLEPAVQHVKKAQSNICRPLLHGIVHL